MNGRYPRNCWYVAALSDEVGYEPIGRTLLDTPIVLYRRESDEVVALEDRCAHRGYPLSLGKVVGDDIVCGYHGCTYDPSGTCTRVLSQEAVPTGAAVRAFPTVEQSPFVWIWVGDPRAAGLRPPPRMPWIRSSGWANSLDVSRVEANFMLLHEHYLDLTHAFVMHPETVPPGIVGLPPLQDVEVSETSVKYSRDLPTAPLAEWERRATRLEASSVYRRREEGMFVSPAAHVERYAILDGDGSYDHLRIQAFTPETTTTTHVFLQIARNYALDRAPVTNYLHNMFNRLATRDRALLEVIAERAQRFPNDRPQVNVTADRAATRARRIVQAMVAEESGRSRVRPTYVR